MNCHIHISVDVSKISHATNNKKNPYPMRNIIELIGRSFCHVDHLIVNQAHLLEHTVHTHKTY